MCVHILQKFYTHLCFSSKFNNIYLSVYYIIKTALKGGTTFAVGLEIPTLIGEKEKKKKRRVRVEIQFKNS